MLKATQRALGAGTATETIESALDLAVFQRELLDGKRAMLGVEIFGGSRAPPRGSSDQPSGAGEESV